MKLRKLYSITVLLLATQYTTAKLLAPKLMQLRIQLTGSCNTAKLLKCSESSVLQIGNLQL